MQDMLETDLLPSVGLLYGAFYFGTLLTTMFYGVACMQTFFYYVHYPNDPLRTKIFVAVLWAFNTLHEGVVVSGTYKYLMAGLVNPFSFLIGSPELVLGLLSTATVSVPSQGFFVYRIYIFSGRAIVVPFLWVLTAIVQLGGAIVYVARAMCLMNGLRNVNLAVLGDSFFTTLVTICLSVAAGVDILLAIFLTSLLIRKRTSGLGSTGHALQSLTAFAVNTGIWTATFALLSIILMHIFPNNSLYLVPGIPLCPVYCNTLLANLNGRTYLKRGWTSHEISVGMNFLTQSIPLSEGTRRQNSTGGSRSVAPIESSEDNEGGITVESR